MNSYNTPPPRPPAQKKKGRELFNSLSTKNFLVIVQQPQNPWELSQMKLYKNNSTCKTLIVASIIAEIYFSRSVDLSTFYISFVKK